MGWTTSYQGGSSSSAAENSTDDDDTDVDTRGRSPVIHHIGMRRGSMLRRKASNQSFRSHRSEDSDHKLWTPGRSSFTRPLPEQDPADCVVQSITSSSYFPKGVLPIGFSGGALLTETVQCSTRIPFSRLRLTFSMDTRLAGETLILIFSLLYNTIKLHGYPMYTSGESGWTTFGYITFSAAPPEHCHTRAELYLLLLSSYIYIIWTRFTVTPISPPIVPETIEPSRSDSPRLSDSREIRDGRKQALPAPRPFKDTTGFVWMTVPKNYRNSSDDGILTGLLLPPLIATSLLYLSLQQSEGKAHSLGFSLSTFLPENWIIEPPLKLSNPRSPEDALHALILSRMNLVNISTLCSTMLLLHVCASWFYEARCRKARPGVPEGERASVPRSEVRRFWLFVFFGLSVTIGSLCLRLLSDALGIGIWQHMSYVEIVIATSLYQSTLYIAIRLAHRVFTLGELGLVAFGAICIFMELLNFTVSKIWPITIPYIRTYRLPTPLLIFQIALIAGSFLVGFMLSPLLVYSRYIAQQPSRRFRDQKGRLTHRRSLAAAFYGLAALIIGGVIGLWTRWRLGGRDPWLWAMFYLLDGRRKWSRGALLAYWGLLGSISVAGWTRQLARSRRYPHRSRAEAAMMAISNGDHAVSALASQSASAESSAPSTPPVPANNNALGLSFPTLPNLPNLPNLPSSQDVANVLDAADKHVPTLSLNARRKFFHILAVVMFVPGIAIDPAFTHLAFSVAFALFTFVEYIRFFAVYPLGAAIHLFMNEFLDQKDGGTVILSHFYLLTGCAGSLWFEGPTRTLHYTGILVLGIGDALASIVGKRIGKYRWSPSTNKTIEGSLAFALSVLTGAYTLRLCGLTEMFSLVRYTTVVGLSATLEALSDQNDNLTLPLFMWSMLAIANV